MSDEVKKDAPAPAPAPAVNPATSEIPVGPVPPEKPEIRRLFVGVRLSVATANALAKAAETLARRAREQQLDLRWVAPASYHVTLKFLGFARAEVVEAIRDRLGEAGQGIAPFKLRAEKIGGFPSLDRATVLWAGVSDPSGALATLAARVEAAMVDLGFPAQAAEGARSFHPHITLARAREPRSLSPLVVPVAEQMFGDSGIDAITLFESETKSAGSVYKDLARIPLNRPAFVPAAKTERQTSPVDLSASTDRRTADEDTDDGWPRGQGPAFPGN